jgi:hypothetical protein
MTLSSLLLSVKPARAAGARDLPALETTMASLALDERTPVALELAATATSRHFLLRSEQKIALRHLARQVQARYPQAVISPLSVDPLKLAPKEVCSAVELCRGAASYLPLRSWKEREWQSEGTDPLLGVLAAFDSLPPGARAVAQLALLPASPTWSAQSQRFAVEHPLEQERARSRFPAGGREKSLRDVLMLVPPIVVLLLFYLFHGLLPPWLLQVFRSFLRGKAPQLTAAESSTLVLLGGALFLAILGGAYGLLWLSSRLGGSRIYDQRLVAEKTARPAYRVRFRLFVIAPGFLVVPKPASLRRRVQVWWRCQCRRWKRVDAVLASRGTGQGNVSLRLRARTLLHMRWRRWRAYLRLQRGRKKLRVVREDVLRMLTAAYRQYHLASGGFFAPTLLSARRAHRLLLPSKTTGVFRRTGWSAGLARSRHLLSVADLAALWHLPQAHDLPELPYVDQESARTLLAPAILSTGNGYPLGVSTHAGQSLPVFFPFECLLQNILVAASTGKGKSNLLEHLMQAYALARLSGHPAGAGGALFVDPHGDQVEHVSGTLPANLVDDVVLIRLADRDYPIGFNPLDMSQGQDRDKVIDNLIQVVEALWPTSYGPRTENFLEYGCKTLAEANLTIIANNPLNGPDQQFTLLDVVHLFRQEAFRYAVFELVEDKHILNWWNDYYEQLDGRQQAEFTSSLVTKISKFASSQISRRILGQPRSTLTFADVISQDKLVLLSCAAGEVGADLAALFGSLLLGFFQTTLAEQARTSPEQRHRFLVLIDEFQTLKVDYQTMLAELRKYGGSFALATQSLAYLDRFERTLRATVLTNVEHTFAFAMAAEDARLLHVPGVEPEDILHIPDYSCYARISRAGQRLPTFSLRLNAPKAVSLDLQRDIVNRSRERYGRPIGLVDQGLLDSEARRQTMRPARARRGAKGYEVVWTGTGEDRVREVLASEERHRGSRGSGKGGRENGEETTTLPQHLMYQSELLAEKDTGDKWEEEGTPYAEK